MRYLLIAIFTLSVCACAGPPDRSTWIVDVSQGCYIEPDFGYYSNYGDLAWDGDCFYGDAMGPGTLRWVEPDGTIGFYRTCMRPEHPQSRCSLGSGF